MNELADITLVLDCSTSMDGIRASTLRSVNNLIVHQKLNPLPKVFSLLTFSSSFSWRRVATPIAEIETLTFGEYRLSRGTRLLDAMAEAITSTEKRLSKDGSGKGRRVLIATMTDGMEHCSRNYSRAQVFNMILEKRRKDGWGFLYMGANQDAFQSAVDLGIPKSHALNFEATNGSAAEATGLLDREITKFTSGEQTGFYPAQEDPPADPENPDKPDQRPDGT